ncbi:MAG: malate synthase A [Bdellovibrionales bacterium]|nr:malate synthase A [Bdellovibrionales bacterium]
MDRQLERGPLAENSTHRIEIRGPLRPGDEAVLTPEALLFLQKLQETHGAERESCLKRRIERQSRFDSGELPDFLPTTQTIRSSEWTVSPAPAALEDRRVEITGPVDRKMMINALNSGARVFMADLEDSQSPTWTGILDGQLNLRDAVRGTLSFVNEQGKRYEISAKPAALVVRPRGWHLEEAHLTLKERPLAASLVDFGLFFFHNAHEQIARGAGPYFYLPKLESHLEARLWNKVFETAQKELGIPLGTIRATVLIETLPAAFEMDEILYELRTHAAGLNAGRWDYIFSVIKKLRSRPECVLPDRADVTMAVPMMRAYAKLLVRTCHRRGAHAIGGMSAFIPSRKDAEVNARAMSKVKEDKEREAGDGFDGTWVAHPDLVPVATEIFGRAMGSAHDQKHRIPPGPEPTAAELLDVRATPGKITEAGLRANVNVALQYLHHWLRGTGAVAIHNLMEDAATAEISRAQLWQWIRHAAATDSGLTITSELYRRVRAEEQARLESESSARFADAAELLDEIVLAKEFPDFLTLPGYRRLIRTDACS